MLKFNPLSLCLLAFVPVVASAQQIVGPSINMVSGTQWPGGDPYLQRQNGPSFAVSTRNPLHLISGDNDYRTVDIPGLANGQVTGDAWLGVFQSADGGKTWRSTLLPGYPQDTSAVGMSSPAYGYSAGTDPVMRPGTNGMAYYAGLVFNRTPAAGANYGASAIIVGRYIDTNPATGDSFQYLDTHVVAHRTALETPSPQFTDKPWIGVDIPRAGAQTCTVGGSNGVPSQSFPGGNVYVTYTVFNTDELHGAITFQRSTDCGVTWGAPISFTDATVTRQSTVTAIDPNTGAVYIAWRQFATPAPPATPTVGDAIYVVKSTDGGQTFTAPQLVANISPFDQGSTLYSFRTNSYPTMVVDSSSRVYIAWAQRGVGTGGDARIVISSSTNGSTWSVPTAVDNQAGRGHQFMPAMTFAGGHLMLIYYDLRDDSTVGIFTSLGGGTYSEARQPVGDRATGTPTVFTTFVDDTPPRALRHTIDVRVAQGNPAALPVFNSVRVSSYEFGTDTTVVQQPPVIQQLQIDPPNFPLFSGGTQAYIGDYLDIAALAFVHDANGNWIYNTAAAADTIFHGAWTDNRDVRPPTDGNWSNYTPPLSPALGLISKFDPTQPTAACVTGQEGMRNQNIYTATITSGLVTGSPGNSKTLNSQQLKAFVLTLENTATTATTFRLTIQNQPTGGRAVFSQSTSSPTPLTTLDVTIPPESTIARTLFSSSTNPAAQVKVLVQQITAPGGTVVAGGLTSTIILNSDTTDPNLGPNSPNPNIEIYSPAIANPNIANPNIANPNIANPNIANPNIANPNIANPNIANPNIANPNIANPNIANPNIANPNIGAGDLTNGTVTDTTWTVTNNGDTPMAYTIKNLLNTPIPAGFKTQLLVHQVYQTPVSVSCQLELEVHTKLLVNIVNPVFENPGTNDSADPSITNSNSNDPTISLGPGETANITLRFVNPDKTTNTNFDYTNTVITTITSHGANTGTTQPPVASSQLIVLTQSLPNASAGTPYTTTLLSSGAVGAVTWSTPNLPANGLSLNPSTGVISGTPGSAASPLSINITATDSSGQVAARSFSITIVTPAAPTIASTSLPVGYPGVSYSSTLVASNGAGSKTWDITLGSLPAGLTLNAATGGITGIPTAVGPFNITLRVTDALGRQATKALTLTVSSITLAFSQQPVNVAPLVSQAVQVKATSGTTGIAGVQLAIAIVLSNGTTFNTVNVTTASGGTVSTNLSLPSGVYHLVASVTGATSATSNTFTVGSPHLAFQVSPSNTVNGLTIAPPVQVKLVDSLSNGIPAANVTLAIGTNPVAGTLSGTLTVATDVNGVATFSDLSINKAGNGYTLAASSPGVTSVTSSPFNIISGYAGFGTDPAGDALPSPQTPSPDLVSASLIASSGNLAVNVQFAPGTYLAPTTSTQIELDTDQNPGTGQPGFGVDPSQVMDAGVVGWDYLVGYTAGNATASIVKIIPGGFTFVGTVPVNSTANGFSLTIPLATLGGISGKMNYKVSATANGVYTDALPNVGLPPIVVNIPGTPAIELVSTGTQVANGTSLNAAVFLTQPAPAPGVQVNLATAPSGVLTVPASVTVPTGLKTIGFLAPAVATGTTTITATSAGYDSAQTTINVPLGSVTMPPSFLVTQGVSVNVPVALSQVAPAGGTTIYVSTINTAVATVSTFSVFVPAGQTVPTTPVFLTGVTSGATKVFASAAQFFSVLANVTVIPPPSLSFQVQPSTTITGQLIAPAPQVKLVDYTGAAISGASVTLSLGANPVGGTLAGTTTVVTDPTGIAKFPDVTIFNGGTGYTLVATAGIAVPATSNPFNILNASNAFDLTTLTLNGPPFLNGPTLRLTNDFGQASSAWLGTKQPVAGAFSTSFTFQITPVTPFEGLADGFAFVIQNAAAETSALGQDGGAQGYGFNTGNATLQGIPNSLAIEFDTYQNAWDPASPHIAIMSNGTSPNSEDHTTSANRGGPVVYNFADGQRHFATVTYDGTGTLQVFVDGNFVVSAAVNLSTLLNLDGGTAYVGFTAGTGGAREFTDIWSWGWGNAELVPLDCSLEASLKSTDGSTPTAITFTNPGPAARKVYWLDYFGQRQPYNLGLSGGTSYTQQTYLTHPWVITDSGNNCQQIFMPVPTASEAVLTQPHP